MQLPAPFAPIGDHIGIALPGGRALFTTRRGGVSTGPYASLNLGRSTDDEPAAIDENRRRLAAAIDISLDDLVQVRQVHGVHVERIEQRPQERIEADGQATTLRGMALLAITADCLPIALVGPGAVAILHAGWRGLANGVIEEGVKAIGAPFAAAIGPGAGGCCYEVGDEVRAAFGASGRTVDLKAIARERLAAAGVAEIHDTGLCTICSHPGLFFSHRRDGGITGRQAGVVWRS
ncbi:MAG TPA: polyphenol oxidase family protein [Conexibacter sp.]|nr:polyphenol oxidase family protein [Conexibacter sp.]